jgi:hypothetical protein
MKSSLVFLVFLCFSYANPNKSYLVKIKKKYAEKVHQYIVQEAYKLLELQFGTFSELKNHIGPIENWVASGYQTQYITHGAFIEDVNDPVYGYSGFFEGVPILDPLMDAGWLIGTFGTTDDKTLASLTHFWRADLGDTHKWQYSVHNAPNAYMKAQKYMNGGWDVSFKYVKSNPTLIVFPQINYNGLINLYKYTNVTYAKVYNISGQRIDLWEDLGSSEKHRLLRNVFWENIGRVAHLLEDMTLPCHAHNDAHPRELGEGDSFHIHIDDGVYKNYTAVDALNDGGVISDISSKNNPLRYLFYTANQIADFYPSYDIDGPEDRSGNKSYDAYHSGDYYKELDHFYKNVVGDRPVINSYSELKNKYPEMEKYLYTMSIRLTATYLYWIAQQINDTFIPIPPNAPTELTGTVSPPKSITYTWKDNSVNETHFAFEYNGKRTTLPANTTSYTVEATQVGKFPAKVRATRSTVYSNYSNTVSLSVPSFANLTGSTSLNSRQQGIWSISPSSASSYQWTITHTYNTQTGTRKWVDEYGRVQYDPIYETVTDTYKQSGGTTYTKSVSKGSLEISVLVTKDGLSESKTMNCNISGGIGLENPFMNVVESSVAPSTYRLAQNYPNPFNPVTTISFAVPVSGKVEVSVFNIEGKKVSTLVSEFKNKGRYSVSLDASKYSSGVYFYRLITNEKVLTKKMILLK